MFCAVIAHHRRASNDASDAWLCIAMSDIVIVVLPGVGTLELTREAYEAALRPIGTSVPAPVSPQASEELVTAKALARSLSLPISCLYEYAKTGKIPSTRVGKHVRFNPQLVLAALNSTGGVTVGRA
jgi:excisionase family DNA binding protein